MNNEKLGSETILITSTDGRSDHPWLSSDIQSQEDSRAFSEGLIGSRKLGLWIDEIEQFSKLKNSEFDGR